MALIRLALPVYVELLTAVVAVGLIDLLWVSGLGDRAVAAVTIATSAENLVLGVVLAVTTGTTVLVGRRDGRLPTAPVVRTAWLLCAAAGLAVAAAGVLLRVPLAGLFTDDATVAALTAGFLLVSMAGVPVFYAQSLADGIFKGFGDTRTPMRNALLCNALVVALDPLFIYGLALGVPGAALATVLARLVTLAVSLTLLLRRTSGAAPVPATGGAAEQTGTGRKATGPAERATAGRKATGPAEPEPPARAHAVEILRTGLPMSGDFLARALAGLLMVDIVGGLGVAALAGYGIGMKIMLAGVMAFYALRQAAMIRTARTGRAGPVLRYGLATGAAVAAVLNVVAAPAAGLFTGDPAVAAAAVDFLRWMTLYLVPFGGLIALGGVLQAEGRGNRLLAATLAGFAVQLPLAALLGSALGATGVWLSMAAGAALSLAGASAPRAGARSSAPGRGPRSTRTAAGRPSAR
ncbi:MATE family efflux transporter [Planomonospora parontospora]|uniref:MATE family efflux transporter n=1 Tax=Planomonospora parontospora TaxID=58119 RepID=UPI0016705F87|nr:MATE family efflux transporter [Planomonospora parontospora]GGL39159.1 MATE family efflux transporter [Planomonospora parontospora subsp. antibiotica]GII18174.1 MATE family efflux transporter [Planomonospora parontospora subsp. antibiotica]